MTPASRTALFIGRFQPFHLGHLDVVKNALKDNDLLLIGIGSAETNYRPANPFTANERFQMIEMALEEANIKPERYRIIPIRNIDNYALWVRHIELYLPPFQKIYTGSPVVRELFENENKRLKNPYKIIAVKQNIQVSSSKIRELILNKKPTNKYLPPTVTTLLKEWKIEERLKNIQEADK